MDQDREELIRRELKREELIQRAALPISVISLVLVTAKEFQLGKILSELIQKVLRAVFR